MMELQQLQVHNVSRQDLAKEKGGVTCKCLPLSKSIKIVYNTPSVSEGESHSCSNFYVAPTFWGATWPDVVLMMHAHSDTKRPEVLCF